MPKLSKADTARLNGVKSKGPVTPEGKACSSQNAIRHGLNSKQVVLSTESEEDFNLLLADYVARLRPAGAAELDLVREIVANRRRMRRAVRMESAVFDTQLDRALEANPDGDPAEIEVLALESLAHNSAALRLLGRYENRLRKAYERGMAELRLLQAARKEQEAEQAAEGETTDMPNEPRQLYTAEKVPFAPTSPASTAHLWPADAAA